MARPNLRTHVRLDRIHCIQDGDGLGDSEPYLWSAMFKIDGETVVVGPDLKLHGTCTFVPTPIFSVEPMSTPMRPSRHAWNSLALSASVAASVQPFPMRLAGTGTFRVVVVHQAVHTALAVGVLVGEHRDEHLALLTQGAGEQGDRGPLGDVPGHRGPVVDRLVVGMGVHEQQAAGGCHRRDCSRRVRGG